MAERTREQIEEEIMAERGKHKFAQATGDTIEEKSTEARITTLLRQWQAVHDDELLGQVPLQ